MAAKTETKPLDEIIREAEEQFRAEIDKERVKDARRADERAAEIAGEYSETHNFSMESEEHEALVTALCKIAGEEFPGDWEDYPLDDKVQ